MLFTYRFGHEKIEFQGCWLTELDFIIVSSHFPLRSMSDPSVGWESQDSDFRFKE